VLLCGQEVNIEEDQLPRCCTLQPRVAIQLLQHNLRPHCCIEVNNPWDKAAAAALLAGRTALAAAAAVAAGSIP
jgi:hypothetical protein